MKRNILQDIIARLYSLEGNRVQYILHLVEFLYKDRYGGYKICMLDRKQLFRMNNGKPTSLKIAFRNAIFSLKAQIVFKLQDLIY